MAGRVHAPDRLIRLFAGGLVLARHEVQRLEKVGDQGLLGLLAGTDHVAVELDRRFEGDRVHARQTQLPDHGTAARDERTTPKTDCHGTHTS